ncbi:archaeal proteasome endopeptidase complex subunit alpha [Candidatus Woesearchaeota archaeon]|nr:archaeal proteasome endopeptidase complex subunit alpha [Candidatus Woesearchaeota archaeon]
MEPTMSHQMMGYDRAITMFSPDGRLLQVEYAKKTVRQGSTAIGMVCKDGILLLSDKRIVDPLIVPESVEKIWKIDDHMGATASGIISDARILIERAQLRAQQHRVTYDTEIDTLSIVKDMCNVKQICTQSGGLRPFGVSILVAGIDDDGPKLFETDPTGIYFRYKATAIGEGETEAEEILHKNYNENLDLEDGLKLAIKALTKSIGTDFDVDRIDVAYIKTADKRFSKVDRSKVEKLIAEIKKQKDKK